MLLLMGYRGGHDMTMMHRQITGRKTTSIATSYTDDNAVQFNELQLIKKFVSCHINTLTFRRQNFLLNFSTPCN